jgi:hypothetical protein
MIDPQDLHRLRQMRDDLHWLRDTLDTDEYRNTPYRHYMVQLLSTAMLVRSIIKTVEKVSA